MLWLFSDSAFVEAVAFVGRHPAVLQDICTLSVAAMLGQLCILYTIREFGGVVVRDNHDDETILVYFVVVLDFHAPVNVHAMARDRDGFWIVVLPGVFEKSTRRICAAGESSTDDMREPGRIWCRR